MYTGKNIFVQQRDNGVVELVFDVQDSTVNIFNDQTISDLSEALTAIESAPHIQGLLVRSAKDSFIAGADIKEFGPIFTQGPEKVEALLNRSNSNFNRLEALDFPVVVAINGFALGGGCEVALACDYRIASSKARIGLPEVRLGIMPGWGGSVRLPRIAGIETAVEWIVTAKDQQAGAALKSGVIDGVVDSDQLDASACKVLQQCIEGKLNYRARRQQKQEPLKHNQTELTMSFTTCKAMVEAQAGRHFPAPLTAVMAMEKSAKMIRDDALKVEAEAFIQLTQTPVASALVGIFLNDQLVVKKAKSLAKLSNKPLNKSAVLGAGIMGGGIAYQSAYKGIPIKMKDINQSGVDLGLSEAKKLLIKQVEKGRLSINDMGDTLNRIEPTLHYDGFTDVNIVVEAVVENSKVKQSVLSELENYVTADTVITSNTSTISIDHLAKALQRPENFCGMHFFNPVPAMPLVEIIRGSKTSDSTIAATVAYANAMGKKAIVVRDCPGFLVNRVVFPYFIGFSMLVRDGADFQYVDKVMERWGWPMGPAYLLDVVGLDTGVHAESVMAQGFPKRMQRDFTSAADIMFKAGRLGQKNGKGFYQYEMDKKGRLQKRTTEESYELIKPHISVAQTFTEEQIIARMMIPMATELARCLEEGVVASPAEADMALIYGLGFPLFRGGLFRWLDHLGIDKFCKMVEPYKALGSLYKVTSGMERLCQSNGQYYPVEEV
ncbi:multifunctional fatty acid oxidation complex subunit alpha [Candidatus Endobugula sertula]|uniref:enoyl-CoA hydratase n=1 Tax=Candidatus Endobugula sertula TaxID=62101 RepID=A0A1D2QU73_9GAMM|nr:multifunctional fatty acid oxidation complex subunit alpha [Candidatus Endobugula sertula]